MIKKRILIIYILLYAVVSAQEPISIHQLEYQAHRHLAKQPSFFDLSGADIMPLDETKSNTLSAAVFGYLPDWEYSGARQYLQYDLLSHLAAFDFTVSKDGAIAYPGYWPWTDVINDAHKNGVKVIMTAVNFNKDDIRKLLTDTTAKTNFFINTRNILKTYNLDGVNIDFEGLYTDDRGSLLNSFMQELTTYIHSEVVGAEVSFAGPAVNWGGWDLWNLAQSCDYIFIMGYAFSGSWSSTSGPNAPLTGGTYNITNTVDTQYGQVTTLTPQKLILGVPYYGSRWKTNDNSANSSVIEYINHPRFSSAYPESQTAGLLWDEKSNTPWYTYQEATDWLQVWFDTDESLALKYDLADNRGYRGVGMWALGYDGSRTELWDEIRRRYSVTSIENLNMGTSLIPEDTRLFQNYPNPFNPVTAIGYRLSFVSEVELSVYDLLGQKIVTLVSGQQNAGSYEVEWNAAGMPSGIYYYQLVTDEYTRVMKMILLQ